MGTYKSSYYNIRIRHNESTLLFNGKTGALFRLNNQLEDDLSPLLGQERPRKAGQGYSDWSPPAFALEDVPASVATKWQDLVNAGIFVEASFDEREQLRSEYVNGRTESPFYVTVTTTLNCNMSCYYCYQNDEQLDHMSLDTCDEIVRWIKDRIDQKKHKRLYLEWYGGEPMLNRAVVDRLSEAVIPYCDEHGVTYKASMICNGTNWPADAERFLRDTRMFRVQVSMDGPARFHNKSRGKLPESGKGTRTSSYDEVMETVGRVIGKTIVYFRINVDPRVGWNCLEMIDEFVQRGWMTSPYFYPYIALINAMTEHCGFIERDEKFKGFQQEFTDIQKEFYKRIGKYKDPRVLEKAMYYPTRKLINCAAVNDNAVVFGPNGLMYKCGLDVGDHFRAHDALGAAHEIVATKPGKKHSLPTINQPVLSADRWDRYDPFTHERCKECQYLPVCLGGCPKSHLERNEAQVKANSMFFETQFDRMVREYYDTADRVRSLE